MIPRPLLAIALLLSVVPATRAVEAFDPALPVNEAAIAQLNALKPNQAVTLAPAQIVGEFNETARQFNLHKTGPMGRDFTIKMAWAPERRRALFCGANHGVPHRLNDVWEFDLAALTWAMLYAPDNTRDYTGIGKDFSDVEFKDGVLVTKRGGPAVIAHTWWGLTYDPVHRLLLFMNTWVTDQKKAVAQVGGDPAQLYAGPPLVAFSPERRRWIMLTADKPYPRAPFGGLLEYIPELQGSIWHTNNWQMQATWLYDTKSNAWRDLKPNAATKDFEKQAPAPEQVGYYDPKRQRVIVHRYRDTFQYDPTANEWKKVLSPPADSDQAPFGHDAYAPLAYDPASGHGLLVEFKTNTLWAYDPDQPAWIKLKPEGDPMPSGNKRLAYVDPVRNVFVILQGTTVWAYRYR